MRTQLRRNKSPPLQKSNAAFLQIIVLKINILRNPNQIQKDLPRSDHGHHGNKYKHTHQPMFEYQTSLDWVVLCLCVVYSNMPCVNVDVPDRIPQTFMHETFMLRRERILKTPCGWYLCFGVKCLATKLCTTNQQRNLWKKTHCRTAEPQCVY